MPIPTISSPAVGMGVEQLTNLMFQYYRELQYLLGGQLDSTNVREITTDKLVAGTAKIGTALIEDLIVGTNVQIGSAEDAAGVTTIIGNTVTTSFVNALSITAGSVAAENITGTKITGKTMVGGKFMNSAETYQLLFGSISGQPSFAFEESDSDIVFGVYAIDSVQMALVGRNPGGLIFINDGTFPGRTYIYGTWDFSTGGIANFPGYTHNHDDRYFTESQADLRFAPISHTHDDRYYTESEADAKFLWGQVYAGFVEIWEGSTFLGKFTPE